MCRGALVLFLLTTLSGCLDSPGSLMGIQVLSAPLVIGDASQGVNDTHGEFTGLNTILDEALAAAHPRKVEIVLVHGMSDHCPGYGVDPATGWLSTNVLENTFHLTTEPNAPNARLYSFDDPDNGSKVYLALKQLRYPDRRSGGNSSHSVEIEVAEFTYSGLFHDLKSDQLRFDFTKYWGGADSKTLSHFPADKAIANEAARVCGPPITPGDPLFGQERVLGNQWLKENLMDRYLSDVVLYIGQYGQTVNDSMAEALCRVTSERPRDQDGKPAYAADVRCSWSEDHQHPESVELVFMSHSLGGRAVYDTLLELMGCDVRKAATCDGREALPDEESRAARSYIGTVVSHRLALYMFANQLPLLGLAYAPITTAEGGSVTHPLFASAARTIKKEPATVSRANLCAGDGRFSCFERVRKNIKKTSAEPAQEGDGQLDFVAFSDPNDLFTFPVPPAYAAAVAGDAKIRVSNVYGENNGWWLGILENPESAHVDYMLIARTWEAVWHGAKSGKVLK